ncbi:TPA: hypothetical protein ACR3Y6_005696 [Bacillus thuringiensis]
MDVSKNNSNMSYGYPRYSLTKDPQNTDYKEWLNMCDSNTQFVGNINNYSSPEAALSVQNAISTSISTILQLLSSMGVPGVGTIAEIINLL